MADQESNLIISSDFIPQHNISFHIDDKQVGKLSWDDGVMEFEGNMKESAERFFEFLKPYIDMYIKEGIDAIKQRH